MRRIYLDNVRFITVVIVMIYHVFYLFNAEGIAGAVGSFTPVQYQDIVMYLVYPWFMVLLFVVAGMCAEYSLDTKTQKEFIKSRTKKLLVPSTLGLFAFQFTVGYFNIKMGGAIEQMPAFMIYPISAISGIGPLWFAQMLWVFSLIIVLLRKADKNKRLKAVCSRCNTAIIVLLFALLWGGSQILNMPVLTMYRFGIYFVSFLIGYYVLSNDEIQDKIEKIRIPLAVCAVIMGAVYAYTYFGKNFTSDEILKNPFTNLYAWVSVLAVLSFSKARLNKENKFTEYMKKSSFGFYVLHYAPALISCYYLKKTQLPTALIYALAISAVLIITPILYEIIKRIPVYRFCVLGSGGVHLRRRNSNAEGESCNAQKA